MKYSPSNLISTNIPYSLYLFLLIGVYSCSPSSNNVPVEHNTTSTDTTTVSTTANFPEGWLGTYEGNLEFYNSKVGKHMEMPMTVIISETDTANRWHWYSKGMYKGREVIKDYHLVRNDSMPKNHYYMDENNGIILDRVLLGNAFYDYFEISGTGLYSVTRKVGDDIHFEISSFPLSSVSHSTYQAGEFDVDTVSSFKVMNTQKVVLKRKK